jgi:hypothetical protein
MAYTTIDKPTDYFNTKLYAGDNATSNAISGVGFKPDWLWIKNRSATSDFQISDIVRGKSGSLFLQLRSNTSDSEVVQPDDDGVKSLDSDGFTVGHTNSTAWNNSGNNYVAWNWLASNTTASDTNGSINSTVSANTTIGFSIVGWTHDGGNSTIGHGLGAVPQVIITKERNNTGSWNSYFSAVGNAHRMVLQGTNAKISSSIWNSTTPTSTVFSMNDSITSTMIAYCFAEKKGYSKFGSYKGNGSTDGTFVYTGFRPAWVMSKRTDSSGNSWRIFDNKRPGFNTSSMNFVHANLTNSEDTGDVMDLNSNGFKIRTNSTDQNTSGSVYIYMAFAEFPFVTSTGIPTTAR